MTFLEAIEVMNNGGFVSHKDWNDGSFLWIKPGVMVESSWCKDPILKMLADANGGKVKALPVICKYDMTERTVNSAYNNIIHEGWKKVEVEMDGKELVVRVPNGKSTDNKVKELDLFEGADMFKKPNS